MPAEQIPGYTDLHRIGHGGFSVVYRAQHAGLARVVALKVLTVEFIDASIKRRFLREVQLAGRLSGHPNVVTVLDSGMTSSGRPFIAMDYYERGSLRDRLAAEGPLALDEVLRVGIKIAGALAVAHAEGILHRDVKPQNILMSRYGEPALADFGTARLTAELDASARTEALTPFHAAPEVLEGHPPGPAADVYSLGSTLYQLLTGRPAFQRDADFGIAPLLLRILTEELPPISRPDVPEQVATVIGKAMQRDPAQRYESAQALVSALRQQQQALGLPATETAGGIGEPAVPPPPQAGSTATQTGPASTPAAYSSEQTRSATTQSRQEPVTPGAPGEPRQDTQPEAPQPPAPEQVPPGIVLSPITATPWDYAEKTGYRPPAAATPIAPAASADQGTTGAAAEGWPDDTTTVPRRQPTSAPGAAVATPGSWAVPDEEQHADEPGAPPPATPRTAPRRGWRAPVIGSLGVAAALAVAIGLLIAGRPVAKHIPRPAPSVSASQPTASPAPAPTGSGVAPTGLTVQLLGAGTAGILRWSLQPGNQYPLVLQQVQPPGGTLISVGNGVTSYTVTGLNSGVTYCFRVATVPALGASQTQFDWSNTACTG